MSSEDADNELTAGMWHLLQSMLQDRIRQAEQDGYERDHPSSVYRADLSRRLLWHEMRARDREHLGHDRVPDVPEWEDRRP